MKSRDVLAVFNRGRISRLAIARTDVSRVSLSAEVQTNWMPRTLGSMMVRPGLGYVGAVAGECVILPFIYSNDDSALLELTASTMRIWNSGDTLLERPAVSTTITNPTMDADLTGWTDADDAGATSSHVGTAMRLLGTGYASARRRQEVSVAGADEDVLHALRIRVGVGPVVLRIGTTAGNDDIFRQAVLREGWHSIAFVPGGSSFHIEFASSVKHNTYVDSCDIEADGVVTLPTPWDTIAKCQAVRWAQSSDVVFCACAGQIQQRIERRPNGSWSVVNYFADDGPFLTENTDNIRITPSALTGDITLTASRGIFNSGHVDSIWRLTSQGQVVQSSLSSEATYTNSIRVTGVEETREFDVIRSGTWSGTLSLQRSIGEPGAWVTVATYTTNGTTTYDDGLDNTVAYYRFGFEAGNYSSGTAVARLEHASGSITGTVRVTAINSTTQVAADVLKDLGGTSATEIWSEGAWSDDQGWPDSVGLWEGRLWWTAKGRIYGSASDAFTSYDPDIDGDGGPINRSVGDLAVARVNWLVPLQRLICGADGGEVSIRSNSFDEPVTPSNFNAKAPSTRGSAQVPAVIADDRGYFVGKNTEAVFELEYDPNKYDYGVLDVSLLVPEIGLTGFRRLSMQQSPDLRLHAVRGDGTVGVLIRDAAEDVLCWIDVETDGVVEDVAVLPGVAEDRVFYVVRREVGETDVRYLEEWALERQARGGTVNRMADSFIVGSGTISGLDHLEGREVVIWADGMDLGTRTVFEGGVNGDPLTVSEWCVGLGYTADYKSSKLSGTTPLGLSLTQRSRINQIGLILADTHENGLHFGPDFDTLDPLPDVEDAATVDADTVWESYDMGMVEFPGEWHTDNRICLRGAAPRPCTVLAAVLNVDRQDKD